MKIGCITSAGCSVLLLLFNNCSECNLDRTGAVTWYRRRVVVRASVAADGKRNCLKPVDRVGASCRKVFFAVVVAAAVGGESVELVEWLTAKETMNR